MAEFLTVTFNETSESRLSKCLPTMLPDLFLDKPSMLIASRPLENDAPSEVR